MNLQNLEQSVIDAAVAKIRNRFLEQTYSFAYDPVDAIWSYQSALAGLDVATDRVFLSIHTAGHNAYLMRKALIGGLAS